MHSKISLLFVLLIWGNIPQIEAFPKQVDQFLSNYCFECHDDDVQKGGLNLAELNENISNKKLVETWTHVYDRTEFGEMPPKKKKQPSKGELKAFHDWLSEKLIDSDQGFREVVHRRLNREEYQNTLNQLLHINVDFKSILPEDQIAGGFDNNGEALALSTELMNRYLTAAKLAIDSAIITHQQPKTESFTVSSIKEVERYFKSGLYGNVDGRIVLYTSNKTNYSKISTRSKRLPVDGRYRFTFSAVTHRSKESQFFTITASDFSKVAASYKNLGYYEATSTPKTFTIEADLKKKEAIQFFAFGFPKFISNAANKDVPGIAFSPVTIHGPIHDSWPPTSHTELLGNVNLEEGKLQDAEKVIKKFMPKAFRRPITKDELNSILNLIKDKLKQGRSFEASLKVGLVAILCSPQFLYLQEESQSKKINDHELANRLSYFLWSSMPDEKLMKIAQQNQLGQSKILSQQIDRMIEHPKVKNFIQNFTGQWLKLRDINETSPDSKLYPGYDDFLQDSMLKESTSFFEHLLINDLPLENFLDSDFAMLNHRLAKHYKINHVKGVELKPIPLPKDSVRGGVLTQAALLKVTANGTTTSPVIRGVWLLENIIGRHVPAPPPNIEGIEPDIREATTIRETLEKHREVKSCQACHQLIDPPGFALESFDPVGNFRSKYLQFFPHPKNPDWGQVRPSAKVDASGKMSDGYVFSDIHEFKAWLLKNSHRFKVCLTEKLLTYALGRKMGFSDRVHIENIVSKLKQKNGGLKQLIHEIVKSSLFTNL